MTNDYSNEWIYYSFIPTHDHRDADAVYFFLPSACMINTSLPNHSQVFTRMGPRHAWSGGTGSGGGAGVKEGRGVQVFVVSTDDYGVLLR